MENMASNETLENNESVVLSGLSEIDKRELKDLTKAYSDEEYQTVVKVIPDDYLWNELMRRNSSMIKGVDIVEEALGVSLDSVVPISAKAWNEMKAKYDDLKDRFSKIRKISGGNIQ